MAGRPKKRINFLVILFVLLIIFSGLSLIGLFYFNQDFNQASNHEVKFWFSQPKKQVVGEKNTYFVFIQNKEKMDLKNVEVTLSFPEGFIFDSSSPHCQQKLNQGCVWFFSEINKNELQEIKIKGNLLGRADQPQYFNGTLNFYLSGFTSVFQKNFSTAVIPKPSLLLSWQMPEYSFFGQEFKSFLSLENVSTEIIPEVKIVINWPEAFSLTNVQKSNLGDIKTEKLEKDEFQRQIEWRVKDLNSNEKIGINFSGFAKDIVIDKIEFSLVAGQIEKDNFFVQIKKEKEVFLEKFSFKPTLEVNQSEQARQSCSWGDIVPISLSYVNETSQVIKNFALKIKITGGNYIDWNRFYQSEWHYYKGSSSVLSQSSKIDASLVDLSLPKRSKEKFIEWNVASIPAFKEIVPNSKGKIVFNLPIESSLESAKNNEIQSKFSLQILSQGQFTNQNLNWEIAGNTIDLLIQTDLQLDASVRYYNDERVPIGQGPLPLKVGEETHLWVFWRLKNTTNSVKDVLVKTKLPLGINWTEQTQATHGLILYNQDKREVSWQIPKLEPYQGGPYSLVEAGFEITVIPKEDQVNQKIALTESIYWQAQDAFTYSLLSNKLSYLDTSLKDDPWYYGSGLVTP